MCNRIFSTNSRVFLSPIALLPMTYMRMNCPLGSTYCNCLPDATMKTSGIVEIEVARAIRAVFICSELALPGAPKSMTISCGVMTPGPTFLAMSLSTEPDSRFAGIAVSELGVISNLETNAADIRSAISVIVKTDLARGITQRARYAQTPASGSFFPIIP